MQTKGKQNRITVGTVDFGVMLEVPADWSCIATSASSLDMDVDWVAIFPKKAIYLHFGVEFKEV